MTFKTKALQNMAVNPITPVPSALRIVPDA